MGKLNEEANLFRFFLNLEPLFAGETISDWSQPEDDPPDVLCRTASGKAVGVELGSWLDQDQMNSRKHQERIEGDILEAIGEQPENTTRHLRWVWLHPKDRVRMHEIDTKQFRRELFELIAKVDRDWVPEASSMTSDVVLPDPATQPILTKVLHSIQCFPRRANETPYLGIPWITFRSPGGAYDPRQMSEALTQRLKEKREQYLSNTKVRSLAEFVLVIHYDQALVYNTPVIGLKYGFNEAIEEAKTSLAGDSGAFTRIFVMKAVEPGGQVWKIYP